MPATWQQLPSDSYFGLPACEDALLLGASGGVWGLPGLRAASCWHAACVLRQPAVSLALWGGTDPVGNTFAGQEAGQRLRVSAGKGCVQGVLMLQCVRVRMSSVPQVA